MKIIKPRKTIIKSRRAERFVASLLASLTLGHITADKRLCYASPKLPSATSFIRKPLSAIAIIEVKTK